MEIVSSNKRGFTLIEVMIATLILTVGLLALLQTVNLVIASNISGQMRVEGVSVGDLQMSNILAKPFDLISTTTKLTVEQRQVNKTFKNYSVTIVGNAVTTNTKSVDVTVRWNYKNTGYSHNFSTLVSKQQQ